MDFNRSAAPERYAAVGEALGTTKDGRAAVEHVYRMNEAIGIPAGLRGLGVDEGAIPNMAKDAMLSGNILVNPRMTTQPDIEALYQESL